MISQLDYLHALGIQRWVPKQKAPTITGPLAELLENICFAIGSEARYDDEQLYANDHQVLCTISDVAACLANPERKAALWQKIQAQLAV